MKALFIGGTGTISSAITKQLLEQGCELYLLNRGNRNDALPEGAHVLQADIHDEDHVAQLVSDLHFDVVADFIAFEPAHLERDYRLFEERTKQFIFISSASAYQTPLSDYRITEGTPLSNPYWEYSRNKIACEDYLMKQYRETGFPVTIVRPSHTYDERSIPLGVHGSKGSWQVVKRMLENKPVIIHGDGTSLWTLTHNSDFAKGFIGLMGNIHAIGESVHITSDESLTWNQIYGIIADALGVQLNAVHVSSEFLDATSTQDFRGSLWGDKANSVVFDNSKLKRLAPDFVAAIRADQGIKQTVRHILSHPELQREDAEFDEWCDKVISALEKAKSLVNE
ncbi:NAD-dependent dehydratase [Paenibacillus glucanolyticus]|uniref:SDR family oxidoreductase n=1 Tax=Paenibacillus TaxID=44249 RepID=UPI0003E23AE6|nr:MULTISPECIES: SDR family oxidoreductase [Paenibacillus]ANA80069.1 NAD-dependent dehydratase [Paenibacillus glucanolyticus]AVV55906.1 NAD-dependent dehydratase [Paenibacillus glucanolyticus]ETT38460.1 NAD-dependent epimerase/dehydratase [Paenibacillus sp. FSL R5-808]MPY19291.1 SDR family oxidoreductase [Paenibacillus glucanolyticus]